VASHEKYVVTTIPVMTGSRRRRKGVFPIKVLIIVKAKEVKKTIPKPRAGIPVEMVVLARAVNGQALGRAVG